MPTSEAQELPDAAPDTQQTNPSAGADDATCALSHEDPVRALAACRDSIDAVDSRIVELLSERTSIVQEIGRIKRSAQLPVYEPRREDQVFANVTSHNKGPLSDDALRRIFERIIDEMRKVQKDRMGEGS